MLDGSLTYHWLRRLVILSMVVPTVGQVRTARASASPEATLEPTTTAVPTLLDPAASTGPVHEASAPVGSPPDLRLARSLFEQGSAAYMGEDFVAAARFWSLAYDVMRGTAELDPARHVLALDLGQAQLKAHAQGGTAGDLANARRHLQEYVDWVERPSHFPTTNELEDRARAQDLLASIAVLEAHPRVVPEMYAVSRPSLMEDTRTRRKPPAKGLIISGSFFVGLASALGIATGALALDMSRRPSYDWIDGRYVAMWGTSGASIGCVLLGMPLLITGLVRRRRQHRAIPKITIHDTGFVLSGRF